MERKRIVIVGGGFAGLRLASDLDKKWFDVVLIDKNNYHQFQPLLYQVTSSGLEPSSICFPFRKVFNRQKNVTFKLAEVWGVHPQQKVIQTSIGEVAYDYLVIANGSTTNFFGNSALAANAYPMKTIEEAMLVRNRILLQLEQATLTTDQTAREKLLNIAVVGGGATGVEVAGILSEMKQYVIPYDYPELSTHPLNVYLIEASPRLLGTMSDKSSALALTFLQSMGVEVLLNTKVVGYEEEELQLSNEGAIPTTLVIWVSGVMANRLNELPAEVIGKAGRIRTNSFMQVEELDAIFAIGDVAYVTHDPIYPNGHPQVAQVAIQQARLVANNFNALAIGGTRKAFHYLNMGSLATIGRNKAVADLPHIHLKGFAAWCIWLLVHLRSILGVKNKLFVLMDWMWNYFSYNRSIRMIIFRGKRE